MTISSVRARAASTQHPSSATQHSAVKSVSVRWSPGQGVRPPPGAPFHSRGLYVSGSVKAGQTLKIESVKMNKTTKTMTIKVDARGKATSNKAEKAEGFATGNIGFQPERWKV